MIAFLLNLPKNLAMKLIRVYQFLFSFDHSFWSKYTNYRVCVYEPSCSEFTHQAIGKYGLIRGSVMGAFRIARCNGFSKGGHYPVPEEYTLKSPT